jgi:hypothetical protein
MPQIVWLEALQLQSLLSVDIGAFGRQSDRGIFFKIGFVPKFGIRIIPFSTTKTDTQYHY